MELTGEFMTNVELVKNINWYCSAIDDVLGGTSGGE